MALYKYAYYYYYYYYCCCYYYYALKLTEEVKFLVLLITLFVSYSVTQLVDSVFLMYSISTVFYLSCICTPYVE